MKYAGLMAAFWLAVAGAASAQINVEVMMTQDQFLPYESIPVKVRLVNNSGQTLKFGKEDWLEYSVQARDGFIVLKNGEPPVPHDFEVKAAEMATTHADLAPCFNISKPGRYEVIANVRIKDWNRDVTSSPKYFYIIKGTRIWDQAFGLPQSATNHAEPEIRKYILKQATLADQMKLYLQLTDENESKTLKVFSIGPMISFSNPQMRLDEASNLHLLYQEASHLYKYAVINPDGDLTVRQTYQYVTSAPRLKLDSTGSLLIAGGARHLSDNDLPPPRGSIMTNEIPPPVQ